MLTEHYLLRDNEKVETKAAQLNIRIAKNVFADLRTTAKLRGLSVSALVNMLVVKAIREEKAIAPEEFGNGSERERGETGIRRGRGNWRVALENARGMWKDRDDLPELFDKVRKEWTRDVWKRDDE